MTAWPHLDDPHMAGLSRGTHLVLSILRGLAQGLEPCATIMQEFVQCCGTEAQEVVAMLRVFLVALADAAHRPLSVGPPGWRGLTTDERQTLSLIGFAQGSDGGRLDDQLRCAARREARAMIRRATLALAAKLSEHGLRVSVLALACSTWFERGNDLQAIPAIEATLHD